MTDQTTTPLAGPGNLPLDEHPDTDWYANDAWTRFGEYGEVPRRCRTVNEPGPDEDAVESEAPA